jgi:trehalose-phosphatase
MLDYDGTLAPFTPERDQAYPYPGVRSILDQLLENNITRLVIISGRAIESLVPLLGLRNRPEIWGSHGLERLWPDGSYQIAKMDEEILKTIQRTESWAMGRVQEDQWERKPAGLALHTRKMNDTQGRELIREAFDVWSEIIRGKDLEIHEFDGGVELRIKGISKANAVRSIMDEAAQGSAFAYLGDDLTDEDAFKELKGKGLSVLVRDKTRQTAADVWLNSHDQMLEFLRKWLDSEKP